MNFGWDAPENLKKKKVRKDIHDEENHMNTQVNKIKPQKQENRSHVHGERRMCEGPRDITPRDGIVK